MRRKAHRGSREDCSTDRRSQRGPDAIYEVSRPWEVLVCRRIANFTRILAFWRFLFYFFGVGLFVCFSWKTSCFSAFALPLRATSRPAERRRSRSPRRRPRPESFARAGPGPPSGLGPCHDSPAAPPFKAHRARPLSDIGTRPMSGGLSSLRTVSANRSQAGAGSARCFASAVKGDASRGLGSGRPL